MNASESSASTRSSSVQAAARRRWLVGGAVALTVAAGYLTGRVALPAIVSIGVLTFGMIAQLAVLVSTRNGWARERLVRLAGPLDALLLALPLLAYGSRILALPLLLTTVWYGLTASPAGWWRALVTVLTAYLLAVVLHSWLVAGAALTTVVTSMNTVAELAVLGAVAAVMQVFLARRAREVVHTRTVVDQAVEGDLSRRAPPGSSDEFGELQRSINQLLDSVASTLAEVRQEADEVAVFAELFADSAGNMLASGKQVETTAAALATDMGQQRALAESGRDESNDAADEAEGLRARAEQMEQEIRRLVDAAGNGKDRVGRASETLLAIGADVRNTAATVDELSGISRRIGAFAQSIAKIARQTHVLALNAAIEAARAEEYGAGFAVVAEQVRTLAGESGRSARDVAELITEVQDRVEAVALAMAAGEEKVRDVGQVAGEAESALDQLHVGVAEAAELVVATAEISRSQASRMAALAEMMSSVASTSARSSGDADQASVAMSAQMQAMSDFSQTSQRLAQLADRLRTTIFSN